jgi:transposase
LGAEVRFVGPFIAAVFGSRQRVASTNGVLADRGYDADWIRELARQKGAWANIPSKRNRKDLVCFSQYLYRARNLIERFFNKIKQCRRVATDMTNSRPTFWPSSNSHQSALLAAC